jgi:hypothetical protein
MRQFQPEVDFDSSRIPFPGKEVSEVAARSRSAYSSDSDICTLKPICQGRAFPEFGKSGSLEDHNLACAISSESPCKQDKDPENEKRGAEPQEPVVFRAFGLFVQVKSW